MWRFEALSIKDESMSSRKSHMSGRECRGSVFGVRVSNICHFYVRKCFKSISGIISRDAGEEKYSKRQVKCSYSIVRACNQISYFVNVEGLAATFNST